ncbi:hypothetical protein DRO_0212 [Deinococcus radiodurans R1 = ATCC 13939 = DSM 20539]|uniref:hypothetical protein n=1 Tax=Deinococcus radiodurans TaxID=1299 RepID=UPI001F40DBD8|nr:hypothetical protein [Deinococcus radiodurans]UID69220.1 hypothetical protein DRO_0212 [Deinococcus radiodurans R1 = ATCC 13939 = DSM 20539]
MGKKDRLTTRPAFVTLRDLPGTRVMFWVVGECPYCGERHLHPAGNLRTADPGERLGEVPAPATRSASTTCNSPKPQRKRARRRGKGAAQGPSGGWVGCGVRG